MPLARDIYFSASIYGGRNHAHMYPLIVSTLERYGRVLTKHVAAPDILTDLSLEPRNDVFIYQRDMAWLHQAHCLVAETTMPSTGVGIEIGVAHYVGKPILCLHHTNGVKKPSFMVSGNKEIALVQYVTIGDIELAVAEFFAKEFGITS